MTTTGFFPPKVRAQLSVELAALEACTALKRKLEAQELRRLGLAVAAVTRTGNGEDLAYRSLRLEVATMWSQSEYSVDRQLSLAYSAAHDFAATLATLELGAISVQHVREIVEAGAPLNTGHPEVDVPRRASYEARALDYAREETPNRLRPIVKRLVAQAMAASLGERHEAALRRRCVRVVDAEDGMADLIAHIPAETAYAVHDKITKLAQRALRAETSAATGRRARVLDEVRADVLQDLLLEHPGSGPTDAPPVHARINVTIPAAVLAHAAQTGAQADSLSAAELLPQTGAHSPLGTVPLVAADVAELAGYGPIDPQTATGLAAAAKRWERTVIDEAGGVLTVERYRPTPEMRRRLAARDQHCRAPGCRVPAHRCDIDHTIDAAIGGPTSTTNLAHLCRGHHTVKHHTDWQVSQDDHGVLTWVSPTGRTHYDRPATRISQVRFESASPRRSGLDASTESQTPY